MLFHLFFIGTGRFWPLSNTCISRLFTE